MSKLCYRLLILIIILPITLVSSDILPEHFIPLKHKEIILTKANRFQLDKWLVFAIIKAETDFASNQQSPAGACGLMQIMPDTASDGARKGSFPHSWVRRLYDPSINIHIGSWYLEYLLHRFKDNQIAAIAAYNAGPSKVKKWLKANRWDGTFQNVDQIPYQETREYVQRVKMYYKKYVNEYAYLD